MRFSILLSLALCTQWVLAATVIPPPPKINAQAYILLDASTQKVLAEENADEPQPPASLTKIMTSYLAAQEVASGRISLEDEVPISVKAWRMKGSYVKVPR